jgi:hypothetical protein
VISARRWGSSVSSSCFPFFPDRKGDAQSGAQASTGAMPFQSILGVSWASSFALSFLPRGGIMAEVGVAYGDFSRKIIEKMNPDKFYAIDTFAGCSGRDFWDRTDFRDLKIGQQEYIENKFRKEIDKGVFFVKKGCSWEVLETFEDNYFDYVYLDAAHDYESVKKDILVLKKKIKNNGIIQFNDYTIYDWISKYPYGVIRAVDELLVNGEHEIMFFCLQTEGFNDIVVKIKK